MLRRELKRNYKCFPVAYFWLRLPVALGVSFSQTAGLCLSAGSPGPLVFPPFSRAKNKELQGERQVHFWGGRRRRRDIFGQEVSLSKVAPISLRSQDAGTDKHRAQALFSEKVELFEEDGVTDLILCLLSRSRSACHSSAPHHWDLLWLLAVHRMGGPG